MLAYLLAIVRGVNDRRGLEEYWSRLGAAFKGSDAKPLAAYTPFELLEGNGPIEGVVAIEFPDMGAARRWYHSAPYQTVRQYREGAADIEGVRHKAGAGFTFSRMDHEHYAA